MAFDKVGLKYVAQPIPYFLSQVAKLVDFDIRVIAADKKDLIGAKKGSIEKVKIVVVEKNAKNSAILNKFIEGTIGQYKGLTISTKGKTKGQISIKDAKK